MVRSMYECCSTFFPTPKQQLGIGGFMVGAGIGLMVWSTDLSLLVGGVLFVLGCLLAFLGNKGTREDGVVRFQPEVEEISAAGYQAF